MKKLLTLVASCAMMLSLVACGSGDSSNAVTMGAEQLSGTFSPIYYSSSYDGYVVDLVYNKLFEYDIDSKIVPTLAESYEETDTEITVKLKKDIKFSDDTDFDAKDVEFTFKAVSDPTYDGRYTSVTKFLVGYDEYSQQALMGEINGASAEVKAAKTAKDKAAQKTAQAKLDELNKKLKNTKEPDFPGVEVIDDYTVKFTFSEPRNDKLTTIMTFAMMSKDQFKENYKYANTTVLRDEMKNPIGTGPYVLNKWEAGSGASLSKNEKFSLDGEYAIENVIIKPVEMSTEYQEFESGNIDIMQPQIEPKKIGPATNNEDAGLNHYPRGGAGYIAINSVRGATADKAVRQAMTFGFDRQAFVDSYYECKKCKGLDGVEIGYVPKTYNNPLSPIGDAVRGDETVAGLETYDFDIEKAKALLDSAGWVDTNGDGKREKDGQPFEIKVLAIKDHDILNNLIPMWQKSWGEQLGADVKVATVDFNTLLDKVYKDAGLDDWNVFFMATSYTSDSMTDIYNSFHSDFASDGNDNFARLQDPELDALLEAGLKELDPAKALDIWKQAAIKINDNAVMVPVYGNTYVDIYNKKKIKDFKTGPLYDWTKAMKDAKLVK